MLFIKFKSSNQKKYKTLKENENIKKIYILNKNELIIKKIFFKFLQSNTSFKNVA